MSACRLASGFHRPPFRDPPEQLRRQQFSLRILSWHAKCSCSTDWSAMSINEMKLLRFARFGPPSVLRIEELPIPEPGEGKVLVHVKAAAITPSDIANGAGH